MNTLKTGACKMCGHVPYGRSRQGGGGGARSSEAAAIQRDYKKRRRVQPKGATKALASSGGGGASLTSPSLASPTAGSVGGSWAANAEELESEDEALSAFQKGMPVDAPDAPDDAATQAVRAGQSRLFGEQLRAMHRAVRELGQVPEFQALLA